MALSILLSIMGAQIPNYIEKSNLIDDISSQKASSRKSSGADFKQSIGRGLPPTPADGRRPGPFFCLRESAQVGVPPRFLSLLQLQGNHGSGAALRSKRRCIFL